LDLLPTIAVGDDGYADSVPTLKWHKFLQARVAWDTSFHPLQILLIASNSSEIFDIARYKLNVANDHTQH
jgi:hypothetical protein